MTKDKDVGGMGFKDFSKFNMEMLAKQGWRMLNHPNEYWVRMIKGIYFPNSSFLKSKKNAKASWAWVSLLEGQEQLLSGLCLNVGNGKNIVFWEDAWIPTLEKF